MAAKRFFRVFLLFNHREQQILRGCVYGFSPKRTSNFVGLTTDQWVPFLPHAQSEKADKQFWTVSSGSLSSTMPDPGSALYSR